MLKVTTQSRILLSKEVDDIWSYEWSKSLVKKKKKDEEKKNKKGQLACWGSIGLVVCKGDQLSRLA